MSQSPTPGGPLPSSRTLILRHSRARVIPYPLSPKYPTCRALNTSDALAQMLRAYG